jgi:large subunit ribosomal protein L32
MAVPKKKHSKTRRDKRRSHLGLKPPRTVLCSHCKQPAVAHRVCRNCGYYAGVEVKPPVE